MYEWKFSFKAVSFSFLLEFSIRAKKIIFGSKSVFNYVGEIFFSSEWLKSHPRLSLAKKEKSSPRFQPKQRNVVKIEAALMITTPSWVAVEPNYFWHNFNGHLNLWNPDLPSLIGPRGNIVQGEMSSWDQIGWNIGCNDEADQHKAAKAMWLSWIVRAWACRHEHELAQQVFLFESQLGFRMLV